jgi:hypothetical protein
MDDVTGGRSTGPSAPVVSGEVTLKEQSPSEIAPPPLLLADDIAASRPDTPPPAPPHGTEIVAGLAASAVGDSAAAARVKPGTSTAASTAR